MNKREVAKSVARVVVGIGVGTIVGNAIKCNTPETIRGLKSLCVGVGAYVLSTMVGEQAVNYTENKIDIIADSLGVKKDPIPVTKLNMVEGKA